MKQVALLGMPNAGKSTLFNRLTGAHARVGNWPGITVELLTAKLIIGNEVVQLVDLPGIYDLSGYSEDEKVVTTFLAQQKQCCDIRKTHRAQNCCFCFCCFLFAF